MASSGLPSPPSGIDLAQDRGPALVATSVATWALAAIMVICRVLGRRIRALRLGLDDWLIVASLAPSLALLLAFSGYSVSRGVGKHVWAAKPDAVYAWSLGLFIAEICYTLSLLLVKLSILSFYWKTFAVRHSIQWPIYILTGIVCIWAVAVLLVTFLQCLPTHAIWDRFDPVNPTAPADYNCGVDLLKFFYGNAIPTIITDLMILALPVPYIYGLQLPQAQKIALGGIFLVGMFVTIVSVVRFYYLISVDLENPDITWNFIDVGIWSLVEVNIAVLCACLPFLKPVLNQISFGNLFSNPIPSSSLRPSKSSGARSQHINSIRTWGVDNELGILSTYIKSQNQNQLDDDEHSLTYLTGSASENYISASQADKASIELGSYASNLPSEGILVTRDVHQRHQTAS